MEYGGLHMAHTQSCRGLSIESWLFKASTHSLPVRFHPIKLLSGIGTCIHLPGNNQSC